MERFVVASVLVLDKFCIFILNLSVIFFLTMVNVGEDFDPSPQAICLL